MYVFLSLTYFTLYDSLSIYPHLCKWHNFVPFYGWLNGSSAGKESTCNAGDPSSLPGSGRSAGEGKGYSLQYSWASLLAQLVKNPPAKWETWVWSLGWEDPLEKGKATHSSILGLSLWLSWWRIHLQCGRPGLGRSPGERNSYPL